MKNWVAFILGIVAGVVLVFNFFLFGWIFMPGEKNDNITLFEQPGDTLRTDSFEIYEILTDSTAYVIEENIRGQKYLLVDEKCKYFYDYQTLEVPVGKCAVMIGVYKDYLDKKIPVVKILNGEKPREAIYEEL